MYKGEQDWWDLCPHGTYTVVRGENSTQRNKEWRCVLWRKQNQVSDRVTEGRQHWQGGEAKASFKSGICSETEEQEDASLWQSGEKPARLFHHKFKSQGPKVGTTAMGQRGRRKVRAVKGRGAFGMASLSPSSKPFVRGGVPWPLRAWVPWAICLPAAGDLGTATKEWQRLRGAWCFQAVRCCGERVTRHVSSSSILGGPGGLYHLLIG